MTKLIFKIDKKIDFQNHLIQMKWKDKTSFKYSKSDIEYFEKLENAKDTEDQYNIFEKYSAGFYSEENKKKADDILSFYQESWDKVEDIYIKKMEEIHKNKFPYKIVSGVLSTTSVGWGVSLNKDNPWFACPNKMDKNFIKVAMHEIMHGFFQIYFMKHYAEKFNLNNSQIWTIQESLTVLLNVELGDILPQEDLGYPQHQELRKEVKKVWLETKDINKVLDHICKIIES